MSFKTGLGDLVKASDSPRVLRSKDLDGVPLIPNGINNAASAAQSHDDVVYTDPFCILVRTQEKQHQQLVILH